MMGGIINVGCKTGQTQYVNSELTCAVVHAEPGEDKITFANDVAKWILDRAGPASGATPTNTAAGPAAEAAPETEEPEGSMEAKSRL